ERLEAPFIPGFDSLGTLRRILSTGYDYSWFVLNESIISREFALSGSEQNPDITGKDLRATARTRLSSTTPGPVAGMNEIARGPRLDPDAIERQVRVRDLELANGYGKDAQLMAIRNARRYRPERTRIAKPHRLLDAAHGPL